MDEQYRMNCKRQVGFWEGAEYKAPIELAESVLCNYLVILETTKCLQLQKGKTQRFKTGKFGSKLCITLVNLSLWHRSNYLSPISSPMSVCTCVLEQLAHNFWGRVWIKMALFSNIRQLHPAQWLQVLILRDVAKLAGSHCCCTFPHCYQIPLQLK